jgi:hypothetical protein
MITGFKVIFFTALLFLAALAQPLEGKNYGETPLYFIANNGQVNPQARFYARTPLYTLWLTDKGLVFDSSQPSNEKGNRDVCRMVFLNTRKKPSMVPMDRDSHRVNIFRGRDPSRWKTGIPTSRAVLVKQLYNHIDLKVYGVEKQVEYDWIIKPGGSPDRIAFRFHGSQNTQIDEQGNLCINTPLGRWVHKKPTAYQVVNGQKQPAVVAFVERGPDAYGFQAAAYDKNRELIIDPLVLVYSTYLGGNGIDYGIAIAVDHSGCAYVTGATFSTDFPVENPYRPEVPLSGRDAFITKFSAAGDSLVYSTYLGGLESDYAGGIAVDDDGSAYVTGRTSSSDFPIENAFQENIQPDDWGYGQDAFVTKLSPTGDALVYSTYLGGKRQDYGSALAVDSSGSAYITGATNSVDFPLKNPFKGPPVPDEWGNLYVSDAFITKLSPDGGSLVYSTYLGGSWSEIAYGIALDSNGSAYVTGYTGSYDFPTQNAFQDALAEGWKYPIDAFITKLSPGGDSLVYSTYLGGSEDDSGGDIAVDSDGNAYVTGYTFSADFPVENPYQESLTRHFMWDAFVTKFSPTGESLVYSTYLGGYEYDRGYAVAVDHQGCAYIAGSTQSRDFPTLEPMQENLRLNEDGYGEDAFITKFAPAGDTILYSSFLGGGGPDNALDLALDSMGNIYVTGNTASEDFPLENPAMELPDDPGGENAWVAKIRGVPLIDLQVQTGEERTWLIIKRYAHISFTIGNMENIAISRVIIYRKENGGAYQAVREIPASSLSAGVNDAYDPLPAADNAYTYKVEALDADGEIIAASLEQTI